MAMVQVAKEGIEALSSRHAVGALVPQAPLADVRCDVAGFLEDLRDSDVGATEVLRAVTANPGMPRVQTDHQHAARRGANGAPRVELREADAIICHAIEIGSLNDLLPVG